MLFKDAPKTDHERRIAAEAKRQAEDIQDAYREIYGGGDDSRIRRHDTLIHEAQFEQDKPLLVVDHMVLSRFYSNREAERNRPALSIPVEFIEEVYA